MPMDLIHYKELRIIGSYDSTTAYFERALQAIANGNINAKALVSHCYTLDDIQAAFEMASSGAGMKIMITHSADVCCGKEK
jgi:L-iditol 2-dehydrogenase